jgi:hypothetical protein
MAGRDSVALERLAAPDPARSRALGDAWMRHMRDGDFDSAWRVSDEVLRFRHGHDCTDLPRHLQWIWNGEPVQGRRVLVRCYHGLGDTVQFIRYAPMLKKLAAHVAIWAQPELLGLIGTMNNAFDELLPLHDGAPECDYDIDIEVMELPHIFRSTLATIPRQVPYLHLQRARLKKGENINVGLVWAAGEWDDRRSIPFPILRQLARVQNVRWHILQRGSALKAWDRDFGVNSGREDVLEAARVIAGLDLLISVDTLAAHLGGALAVPTWTLLHTEADWRWMRGRSDSPWYPRMRLFRQPEPGNWQSVIDEVAHALATFAIRNRARYPVPLRAAKTARNLTIVRSRVTD